MVWNEIRKLRYLRFGSMGFMGAIRNYWFGEDMPWLRHIVTRYF